MAVSNGSTFKTAKNHESHYETDCCSYLPKTGRNTKPLTTTACSYCSYVPTFYLYINEIGVEEGVGGKRKSVGTGSLSRNVGTPLSHPAAASRTGRTRYAGLTPLSPDVTTKPDGGLPDQVLPCLQPHFYIHREVTGHHPSGKRLRIDAVLVPRDSSAWARPDIALGIEFKRASASGRGDSSRIVRQCLDYTITDFKGFDAIAQWRAVREWAPNRLVDDGFLGEWVPNDPLTPQQHFNAGMGYAISGILGQHNIGELIHDQRDGWSLVKHGGGFHVQWSERRGVCEATRNQLRRKIGSG